MAVGPGVSSCIGHSTGETTSSGVSGWPSRTVSRKPCTAGPKARSRITSVLTTLMPSLTLIRSAGVSRSARAVNGSSSALPASPRLISSTPPRDAASAGQVVVGLAASEPWLIELPWCSHTRRPRSGTGSTGVSARSATSSVLSLCGSQISTSLSASGSPVKRTVPTGPGRCSAVPVSRSMVRVSPSARRRCRPGVRRRAARTRRRGGAVRRGRPAWWAGRPAPPWWRGCGRPAVRRRAGTPPGPAAGRRTGRGPARAAGAAAGRAGCAPVRGRRVSGRR